VHGNEAVLVRLEGGDAMLYQQFCDVGPSLETGSVLLNKTLLSGNDDPSDTEEGMDIRIPWEYIRLALGC